MPGIAAFSVYLPWRRLDRSSIADAHRWLAPAVAASARGTRTMAAWDEDSVTLGVEAVRKMASGAQRSQIDAISFATTTPPFADRQNAGIIAGAIGLREDVFSVDVTGSQRAGTAAIIGAFNAITCGTSRAALVVAADRRKAPAASIQEVQFGDAGAAMLLSSDDGLAKYLGSGTITTDFVDHYRATDRDFDYQWEERWVRDAGLKKIVPLAITNTLKRLGISPESVAHFIFPSVQRGVDAEIAALAGIPKDRVHPNLSETVGDTGVPHPMLMLAHTLEHSKPGQTIVLAAFGQGCDVLVFQTTAAVCDHQGRQSIESQLANGKVETNYMRYLVFNDLMEWDKGKRAERDKQTALTTLYRNRDVIMALTGGECRTCGTRQFPPARICVNPECRGLDTQSTYSFADEPAVITSWSGDHLVFTPDPPLHYGMISFTRGGRFIVEFADCAPSDITIGAPVHMAFRVKDYDTLRGFRRYFWKAIPNRTAVPTLMEN